ncbi:hypothetical protein [Brachybacterium huguangmaarense]
MSHPAPGPYDNGGSYGQGQGYGGAGYTSQPYDQGFGVAEPPTKRGALPWILGCGGCLVLLLIAAVGVGIIVFAGGRGDDSADSGMQTTQPAPAPPSTPDPTSDAPTSDAPTSDAPTDAPSSDAPADPGSGGESLADGLPALPTEVGGYTLDEADPPMATYTATDPTSFDVRIIQYQEGLDAATGSSILDNPHPVGSWTCGTFADLPFCMTDYKDGYLSLNGAQGTPEDMAAWGDEFLAAWQ